MTERPERRIWRILRYALYGIAVLVWLPFLVLIVLYVGAALGLWPISDR
jgi:hypothetical protein